MSNEEVKNVVITEVRLKELLIAELKIEFLADRHKFTFLSDRFQIKKRKIMNSNYSDKGVSK